MEKAIFAGGCFWCIQSAFAEKEGVKSALSGYLGGTTERPTYREVTSGETGHYEAVEVTFDPKKITYKQLLDIFWHQIDPTDAGGQFADRGPQYQTAIFYLNEEQKKAAEASKKQLEESGLFDKPIVTKIVKASTFYPAEEYHQDYYKKEPEHYQRYRRGSGRADFLEKMAQKSSSCKLLPRPQQRYKKPSEEELKKKLTPLQYEVTQNDGTEPAFNNEYWANHKDGIYVDVVSGEPLFSSRDKFDSGTGWPSFTKPIEPSNILQKEDVSHGMHRIEARSCNAGSHLGHIFQDGPQPTGLRYCMNSAALRFVPKEDLEKEGYGEYKKLFE